MNGSSRNGGSLWPCVLSFVFLAAVFCCSAKQAWANPEKDASSRKQNIFFFEEKSATYSRDIGKAGDRKVIDQHTAECMEAPDYRLVAGKKASKMKCKPNGPLKDFPVCGEKDAAWCGSCWIKEDNTWCCKNRKGPGQLPDCGKDSSTCPYAAGCYENGVCANICMKPPKNPGGPTNIKITNYSAKDVTIAFVTAAAKKDSACTDINRMISYQWVAENTSWCKDPTQEGGDANAGHCTGVIESGHSVELIRTGKDAAKCLSGAIMLGGKLSCPQPTGFTQGEFTLNPTDTSTEAVDISLVNGVNYALTVKFPGDAWAVQDGGKQVFTIGPNEGLHGDNNKNGIFPPGCTDCIQAIAGQIPCPDITGNNPKCQQSRICNIYRAGWTGGTVEFIITDLPPQK